MASAAEQLAANLNFSSFANATELKKRIWFTLGALIVYRIGTYIPVPGVDATVMGQLLARHQGGILGMFDMFTGGALGRMTVFALNIMPYISASIIVQLMSAAIPSLEALKKEGEGGRRKLNEYTRYLTVIIALFQAYGIAIGLENMHTEAGSAVVSPGIFFIVSCVLTLVGGTMFLMWLGEQINVSRGGERHFADHLRRYRGQSSQCDGEPFPAWLYRGAFALLRNGLSGVGRRHHCVYRLHGTGAAARGHPVPQAAGRPADVRWRFDPHAAEGQYGGLDSTDLRVVRPADSGHDFRLHE